jgi:tRNA pseudouridine38-40 synthase
MTTPEPRAFLAIVEYDGTEYKGFQVQPEHPTIQGEIERALQETIGTETRIAGAGRTDAGVHALGQVIGFSVAWRHEQAALQNALNARLSDDIAVRRLREAEPGFHPRFSACSRVYVYTVLNRGLRSPLASRYSYQFADDLDLETLNAASALMVGTHDFGTFGAPTVGEITIRRVMRAGWARNGDIVTFTVEANGFLRRMVRTMVSALLRVGAGHEERESINRLLETVDRSEAPAPAPASGLCLTEVTY